MNLNLAAEFLLAHDNFEILTHDYPDGDTLGSGSALCLALQSLGKKARVITTYFPREFEYLLNGIDQQDFKAETIVSVDIADEKLLGANRKKYEGRIALCLDHHAINKVNAEIKYVDAHAGSNCEIMYKLFRLMNIKLTKQIADCLYTGVSTDTGCFKYSNTTADTLRIAADLLELGCDSAYINKLMFDTKSKKKLALERELFGSIEYWNGDRCAVICVTKQLRERLGISEHELEGIASIPRQIEGVLIGITMREKDEGGFKVSVRTGKEVDAAKFCFGFGGGGHKEAAGCAVSGSEQEAKAKLKAAVEEVL